MKALTLIIIILSISFSAVKAQQPTVESLIKAWKVKDKTQSFKAEETYAQLKQKTGYPAHQKLMVNLYSYLRSHPDDRLKVRIDMYDILGKKEYGKPVNEEDSVRLYEDIMIAHKLEDEQLKSELYTLYAEVGHNNYVLYNLKALELQKKIGLAHFKFVHNRYFNASYGLYNNNEYQQSIDYGLQCLQYKDVATETWDPRVYLFQLDIVGASYLKLAKYDSCIYYYRQILDTLQKKPDSSSYIQKLWLGIASGNIGHALILKGEEQAGIPMVQQWLLSSTEFNSYNNISKALNVLAAVDWQHKEYADALQKWKSSYIAAEKVGNYIDEFKIEALEGIVKSYRILHNPDSAYKYGDLSDKLSKERLLAINSKKLSVMKTQMAFDDMQVNLQDMSNYLKQEKTIRNFSLIAIVLLTIISLLIYNRQKLTAQLLLSKQETAKKEISDAKIQLAEFAKHIRQKQQLVHRLQLVIRQNNYPNEEEEGSIHNDLSNYVLVTDEEWGKFKEAFSKAYPLFFIRIKEIVERITPAEERLASLIFLQLSNKQIANTLGISTDSVARSKRRLKSRINLPSDTRLEDYISTLNESSLT
ncbi:helix-turn-helix transcriptional regulator [Sphingobacterium spiritivorum]|uniref:helix-turn-helix transcriptional regulator n=1 Tax=Sphingobacterium spiritivorum TaxID=258 RepID=UPI003DA3CD8E